MSAPDRYADAVRARRAELRADRSALAGTHRAELRTELALARLAAGEALTDGLATAAAAVREQAGRPSRTARRAVPEVLTVALASAAGAAHARWADELGAGLRRAAGARGLDLLEAPPSPGTPAPRRTPDARPALSEPAVAVPAGPGATAAGPDVAVPAARVVEAGGSPSSEPGPTACTWPVLPGPPTLRPPPGPPPRPWLSGAAEGLALWRLALLPLAALPLAGLPVLGGRAWTPLAVGVAAAGLALLVRARRIAADRAVLARWADAAIATTRTAFATHLDRATLSVEPALAADLDAAVARRRAALDHELAAVTDG